MSKVKIVAHPESGKIVTPTSNPEFGTIRVDSSEIVFANNFMSEQKRTAFITGPTALLEQVYTQEGQTLQGRIVKLESFEPFYEGQSPKIYPEGHANAGQEVLTEGKPTYLRYVYSQDSSAPDRFIMETVAEVVESDAQAI